MYYDCIIVGAGAAGLFCSAAFPHKVNGLVLEKTKRIGTKLLMSGNGQCNITHDGSIKDFISLYYITVYYIIGKITNFYTYISFIFAVFGIFLFPHPPPHFPLHSTP